MFGRICIVFGLLLNIYAFLIPQRAKYKLKWFELNLSKGFSSNIDDKRNNFIKNNNLSSLCPCGSKESYGNCCASYHSFEKFAENESRLARARYSAYALGNPDFLIATTHPNQKVKFVCFIAWHINPCFISFCNFEGFQVKTRN